MESEADFPESPTLFPLGHYYSPIGDLRLVRARESQVFASPSSLPGIDLDATGQLELARRIAGFCAEQPFGDQPGDGLRYGFANDFYSYGDALVLYGMLRELRPSRYVEIGSGWSSALVLDTIDRHLAGVTSCTFVEPYPDRLHALLTEQDWSRAEVLTQPLETLPDSFFDGLAAGDILFVDSTHVSRVGSDVNRLFFEVFPRLAPGVHVHVHDIFYPFEYPRQWVYEGRWWNEAYLLRAFLTHNSRARIRFFNSYLAQHHLAEMSELLPLWARNPGGALWFDAG